MRLLTHTNKFRPLRYDLRFIVPSLRHPKFLLLETIHLEPNHQRDEEAIKSDDDNSNHSSSSSFLRLHMNASLLNVLNVVGGQLHEKSPVDNSTVSPDNHDVMTIKIDENNTSKKVHLLINASLNLDEMKGLYRSKYRPDASVAEEKIVWSSHFEPTAARDVFPCVDEPLSRPDYCVSYLMPNNEEFANITSLSNEPVVKTLDKVSITSFFEEEGKEEISQSISAWLEEQKKEFPSSADGNGENLNIDNSNFKMTVFDTLEKMPSYLLCFVIGEIEPVVHPNPFVSPLSGRTIPVTFYISKGRDPKLATFGLNCLRHALEFFESYFNVPLPMKKLDAYAPVNFAIGGEENFGLITLSERVLMDPSKTSVARQILIADLCTHEVSHMWFGDLVSIARWDTLYLKEAFASWFGVVGANAFDPSWNAFAGITSHLYSSLATDSYIGTHPVEVPIVNKYQITEVFDDISYSKGLSIVKMLYHFLGAESFRECISAYLTKNKFRGTTTNELWESFEETSGKPIKTMMNSFTSLPGYPVISVRPSPDATGNDVVLSQSRFRLAAPAINNDNDDKNASSSKDSPFWTIPIVIETLDTSSNNNKSSLTTIDLHDKETTVKNIAPSSDVVVLVNEDHNGFFRCDYEDQLYDRILKNYSNLSEPFRTGLIDDAVALVSSGKSTVQILKLLDKVRQLETSPVVLQHAVTRIPGLFKKFSSDSFSAAKRTALFEKCYGIFVDQAAVLGPQTVEGEIADISRLRPMVWNVVFSTFNTVNKDQSKFDLENATVKKVLALGKSFLESSVEVVKNKIINAKDAASAEFDSNLIVVQLRFAVRFAEERNQIYDGLWNLCKQDPDALVCREIILGLTSTDCPTRYDSLCKEVYDPVGPQEVIRSQLGHTMTIQLISNPSLADEDHLWKIFANSIESVIKRWGSGQFRVQIICENIGRAIDDPEKFLKLFEANPIPNARLAIQRAHQDILLRAEMKSRVPAEVEKLV